MRTPTNDRVDFQNPRGPRPPDGQDSVWEVVVGVPGHFQKLTSGLLLVFKGTMYGDVEEVRRSKRRREKMSLWSTFHVRENRFTPPCCGDPFKVYDTSPELRTEWDWRCIFISWNTARKNICNVNVQFCHRFVANAKLNGDKKKVTFASKYLHTAPDILTDFTAIFYLVWVHVLHRDSPITDLWHIS